MVEDHSCEEFAVAERKGEAFHEWRLFHTRLKKHFDASNELIQRSQARLVDNSVVDYRRKDLKVSVDALRTRV